MASGILGGSDLSAATDTTVYTCPAGKTASATISVVNRSTSDSIKVRISLTPNSAAANNYIEYEASIPPTGVLERSAIVLAAGDKVIIRSTAATCSAVVFGIEE